METSIVDFGDLKGTDKEGEFSLNFTKDHSYGAVRYNRNTLSKTWYCSFEFVLDKDWTWGETEYTGENRFLSNIKIFRLWNPGSTKENVYVELSPYTDSAKFVIEGVDGDDPKEHYFMDGFKEKITLGFKHKFEFWFKENSGPGKYDADFACWFDDFREIGISGLCTRKEDPGLKRPFLLGFANMWEPKDGNDYAPNTFTISNLVADTEIELSPPIAEEPTPSDTFPREPEKINKKLYRLKVNGGWIVMDYTGQVSSLVYVPDPFDAWKLED